MPFGLYLYALPGKVYFGMLSYCTVLYSTVLCCAVYMYIAVVLYVVAVLYCVPAHSWFITRREYTGEIGDDK